MSDQYAHSHQNQKPNASTDTRYRRILWIALLLNAFMFAVELWGSQAADSNALLADAIDFLGDALSYGITLFVLSKTLTYRSRTAVLKGVCMALFGLAVMGRAVWLALQAGAPEALTMGWIGALALAVNAGVAWSLYAYREGDANMTSVWLSARNDAIGNVAVILAAVVVALTASRWPDVIVSFGMGALALQSGWMVMRQAKTEMSHNCHKASLH